MSIRPAAVAGTFYPANAADLRAEITGYLDEAAARQGHADCPKAIIAPHAGTVYSGPVAASAYARLRNAADRIRRVVLLGPAHRVFVNGIAAPSVMAFQTPLGDVALDRDAIDRVLGMPQVQVNDEAHRKEHSLEVHLPFLQLTLGSFALVPLVVGRCEPDVVAGLLEQLWGGDETLVVASSDLSHFHDYATAQTIDRQTSDWIEAKAHRKLTGEHACGVYPVSGLLMLANQRGMTVSAVDVRNSGDTAGRRNEVVGYGSYLVQ